MSVGLLSLLDDVAGMVKMAAASLDDIGLQASKAGSKAAGVVIDDAAVTPRYVTGFPAARELPMIGRIALGSLRNKLIFLLPAALLLSVFAPWVLTPLLMLGGAYLCYEGAEKVYEALVPHAAHEHEGKVTRRVLSPREREDAQVSGAIRTDLILSAEIMTISLAAIPAGDIWTRGLALALVGIGITALVYGGVALIVKADDLGLWLAKGRSGLLAALGRGIVKAMPGFLTLIATIGTVAMLWVGGGILLHGLEELRLLGLAHWLEGLGQGWGGVYPAFGGLIAWAVFALGSGLFGLIAGAALIPIAEYVLAPLAKAVSGLFRRRA